LASKGCSSGRGLTRKNAVGAFLESKINFYIRKKDKGQTGKSKKIYMLRSSSIKLAHSLTLKDK